MESTCLNRVNKAFRASLGAGDYPMEKTSSGKEEAEEFRKFFNRACGFSPFPYQEKIAISDELPQILNAPTGSGKTEAVILAWLWKRRRAEAAVRSSTPRRLVYCLPMRVLVEQTNKRIAGCLERLGLNKGADAVAVQVLMGGEEPGDWDENPEKDTILIGTQDMLLSRALNRGYAMSRYRWPMQFGLLNNDCLWVLDEVQLMGVGVESSAQLQAFREKFGCEGNTKTIWMSATVAETQLNTVDHPKPVNGFSIHNLTEADLAQETLAERYTATKSVAQSKVRLDTTTSEGAYAKDFARRVIQLHRPDSLTLAIINKVGRAQLVYRELLRELDKHKDGCPTKTALIHSRFRPDDRERGIDVLTSDGDRIVISTQVVEAGVDVDVKTLITELAPWPSLVQRFGRCNRKGKFKDAQIEWVEVGSDKNAASPYSSEELEQARGIISRVSNASPRTLAEASLGYAPPSVVRPVLRKRDILDLFDTSPDLSGNDIDVSRFVRDQQDTDVQVFWRNLGDSITPPKSASRPDRNELCPIPISQANMYAEKHFGWVWNPVESRWTKAGKGGERNRFIPGQIALLDAKNGGYIQELGWNDSWKKSNAKVVEVLLTISSNNTPEESDEDETWSHSSKWISFIQHTNDVKREVGELANSVILRSEYHLILTKAAMWHDVGKAHPAFQNWITVGCQPPDVGPQIWAKSPKNGRPDYFMVTGGREVRRKNFRHELASALAWLQKGGGNSPHSNLVAYLIAAHHGKVRLSIRSLPKETKPGDDTLFARGVWDGDVIPPIPDMLPEALALDLSPMQLGEGSWLERTLALRDDPALGPFRIAYLEAILRVADWRASKKEGANG